MTVINLEEYGLKRKHPFAECENCPMKGIGFKAVQSKGPKDAELIVVGEAPGVDEVINREPFYGQSGQYLKGALKEKGGFDPSKVYYTNAVLCRPPDNKLEPYKDAVEHCRPRLEWELQQVGNEDTPILAVGRYGAETTLRLTQGVRAPKKVTITKVRGRVYKPESVGTVNKTTYLTVHPAYVLRAPTVSVQFERDVREIRFPSPPHELTTPPAVYEPDSVEDLAAKLREIRDGAVVSFDVETDNLTWYDRPGRPSERLLALGLAHTTRETIVVNEEMLLVEHGPLRRLFAELAERTELVAHNGKFDCLFLGRYGYPEFHVDGDTMLAHYTVKETPPHGLKEVSFDRYGIHDYEAELITKHKKKHGAKNFLYSMVPWPDMRQYLAWDCATTLQLDRDLRPEMAAQGLTEWPYKRILVPASAALQRTERIGIQVDKEYLEKCRDSVTEQQETALHHLRSMCRTPELNPRSYQQLGKIIWDSYGFRPVASKHWADRSTSIHALKAVGPTLLEHPFIKMLLHYRRLSKILGTYINPILDSLDTRGRAHPSYNLHRAVTGRLSANKPPIQTMPRASGDVYGAMLRACFVAAPGKKLVLADYSQAEVRFWAHVTQDPYLLWVYANGLDLHDENAKKLFGPNFTKEQRTFCKNWIFAYIYGGDEYSFAGQHNLPIAAAARMVREFEALVPVAHAWRDIAFQEALRNGYVASIFGRRRRFPVLSRDIEKDLKHTAWNMPIQSAASDFNLLSHIEMDRRGHNVVITMHDMLGVECDEQDALWVSRELSEVMVGIGNEWAPSVPWKVDVEITDRWHAMPDRDRPDEDPLAIFDDEREGDFQEEFARAA